MARMQEFGLSSVLTSLLIFASVGMAGAQNNSANSGGTILNLPEAQATTPAPFRKVEPSQTLSAPGTNAPSQIIQSADGPQSNGQNNAPASSPPQQTPAKPQPQPQPPTATSGTLAAPPQRQPSIERTGFNSWTLECYDPAPGGVPCQVTHRVTSGDNSQVVLVLSLAPDKTTDKINIQFALPLGFDVQSGVQIEVGNTYQSSVPVSRCTAQGCLVEGSASPQLINSLRKGSEAFVSVQTVEGGLIRIPASLKGFAAAYEAMTARKVSSKN